MTWTGFIRLIATIYRGRPPDLDLIRKLGLLAVKIGQTYALRVDFLPEDSCKHLAQLYRHVDRPSPVDGRALIESATTPEWRRNFRSIDDRPLACASVGQVHYALLNDGRPVVVKVLRRDYREAFVRDVTSLRRLVKTILFFYPVLSRVADPLGILETIEKDTLRELDLRLESEGQMRLRSLHDQGRKVFDLSRQSFPAIHDRLSSDRVMVSEFVEGTTVDELLDRGEMPYADLLDLFRIHGYYLFCVGTFHGDIHPGNIVLSNGQFFFLDTGAVGTVGVKMRRGLFSFFEALARYDFEECARCLNTMADQEVAGVAFDRFRKKMIDLYADFTNATVSQVSLTRRMMETIRLGVLSGMVFEKGMYPIIKSLMYLDGMVLRCNPDAVLIRDMQPFIADFKALMS